MKILITAVIVCSLEFLATNAFAGGAVAARQQRQQQQQIIGQHMVQQAIIQRQQEEQLRQPGQGVGENQSDEMVEEVDIKDLWKAFEKSSEAWSLIMDPQVKVYTVAKYIETYHQKKISIKKSPVEYVRLIDDMSRNNPDMLKNPFERILMIVAIIEYDFENGQDKNQMALQILGQQGFLANKQRLGLK